MKRSFISSLRSAKSSITPGLFGMQGLVKPEDFNLLSKKAIDDCNILRDELKHSNPLQNPSGTLLKLDKISNIVCTVIDAAEMCRNVHFNDAYRSAANECFYSLSSYMRVLNTDPTLYDQLKRITDDAEVLASLSEEEQILAADLRAELERDGVHLKDSEKDKLRDLHAAVVKHESEYIQNISNNSSSFAIGPLNDEHVDPFRLWMGNYTPQPTSLPRNFAMCISNRQITSGLLRQFGEESIRKQILQNSLLHPADNKHALGSLIKTRQLLAKHLGYSSFAHKYLANKVLTSSSEVQTLLVQTAASVQGKAERELEELLAIKKQMTTFANNAQAIVTTSRDDDVAIQPWDLSYLIEIAQNSGSSSGATAGQKQSPANAISEYFMLSDAMTSLEEISSALFGLKLKGEPVTSQEAWDECRSVLGLSATNTEIVKYSVSSASGEPLGTIYIDFFSREKKFSGAAHFTIQCGCLSSNESGVYQTPIVALVFNINPNNTGIYGISKLSSLLSPTELEVLYHEWGHAMHSILSRTTFQHLSGTRGSTDFVEVPSHLFEHFARSPQVLCSWAKHYKTKKPLSVELIDEVLFSRRRFSGFEMQTQILYSAVDQLAFGDTMSDVENKTPEEIYSELEQGVGRLQQSLFGTNLISMPLLSYGHFSNYGGGYYSYLFARMYAAQIWEKRFQKNPLNRAQGKVLSDEFLRYGASRPPQLLLSHLAEGKLDPNYLLKGVQ